MNLGKKLLYVRKRVGLTQMQMTNILGITQNYISQVEVGKRRPSLDVLERVAEYFNFPVSVFFDDDMFEATVAVALEKKEKKVENSSVEKNSSWFIDILCEQDSSLYEAVQNVKPFLRSLPSEDLNFISQNLTWSLKQIHYKYISRNSY